MEERDTLGYPVGRGRDDVDMRAFVNVRLIRTASKLALLFQRQALRPNGLSTNDWRVLINLAKLGDCHLRELSRISTIDASHVSRATKALEVRGLLRRYPDPDDGRRMRMTLTGAGTEMVDRLWPKALELDAQLTEALGESRMADLTEALDMALAYATRRLDAEAS